MMASTIPASSKSSEPSIRGTYPTNTPWCMTRASRLAVPSLSHSASRPPGSGSRIPNLPLPPRSRWALTPRSRSESTTRRALNSSMRWTVTFVPGRSLKDHWMLTQHEGAGEQRHLLKIRTKIGRFGSVIVAMDVYEAVRSRQSVRGFLDRPVPPDVLMTVLSAAMQAPSGGNLQPWHVYVLSGAKLRDLKARVRRRVASGDPGDPPPVPPYPLPLPVCYAERLEDMGARRYEAVGVARGDRPAQARVRAGNWECW